MPTSTGTVPPPAAAMPGIINALDATNSHQGGDGRRI
jgi:hypothetical protein